MDIFREITIIILNEKRLIVSEFDFDDVKSNLKTFLDPQNEFTDYDFEFWYECSFGHSSI